MKLFWKENRDCSELNVHLEGRELDGEAKALISYLKKFGYTVTGKKEDMTLRVPSGSIFYIEAVEDKSFLYCENDVLQGELRLYDYERILESSGFVRISKSCILNLSKVSHFRSTVNRKIEVSLENGEKLEINRSYVPKIQEKLKGGSF